MLNIALFGAPGAGKGTQSRHLIRKYNLAYLSTGDILRKEIQDKTDIGLKVKDLLDKGKLAPDGIIVQMIEREMKRHDNVNGFLFDGFPRTYVQAYILDGLLDELYTSLSCMVSLKVPEKELFERLIKRGKESGRSDDRDDKVIRERLNQYTDKTVPVIDYYQDKGIYHPVDGVGDISDIAERIDRVVESVLQASPMNIVLFGRPGAGKGTQGKLIAKEYDLLYISTGKLFRDEIRAGTEIGRESAAFMEQGTLVPDRIVIKLIEKKIKMNPMAKGFVFKGFPRTMVQAYILKGLLRKRRSSISCMIDISVPMLDCMKRLSERGKTEDARPYDRDVEMVIQRMEEYQEKTVPVSSYYYKRNKVFTVDGKGAPDTVFENVKEVVDRTFRNVR